MGSARIVIIGSGMAGLCMALQLARHGYRNFEILEKSDKIGGTWRDNDYPGCACDVPSHFYSFSFAGNPNWSRVFPPRDEIFAYMDRLAKRYGLYEKTRFNSEVASARFDEGSQKWHVTLSDGATLETDILVTGLGQLNRPKIPHFDGADDFKGAAFHSARWRHDVDLAGKRVAVIGNGPSAVQFIPEVAKRAGHMTLFQRSPCHVLPRNDKPYSGFAKFLFRVIPGWRKFYRGLIYWTLEKNFVAFNRTSNPKFLVKLMGLQGDLTKMIGTHFDEQVTDPHLREVLKPDYPVGCKRVVISDDYLPSLQRENVSVETEGIKRFTSGGIELESGKIEDFDAIIYGTGFESTEFLAPMEIIGAGGVSLNDAWRDGAEAYLGITMPHFPNFFMLYGPNTNLGHNSIIFMIECQVAYVLSALKAMRRRKASVIALKPSRMVAFADYLKARLSTSVWEADCDSWYKNEAGKVTNNWPDFTYIYEQKTKRVDPSDYDFDVASRVAAE